MHTDIQQNKKPTGSANYPAGNTDAPILQSDADTGKAFATLAARYALAGHTLTRCSSPDGAVMYYAGRWGMSRALPDLQSAAQLLIQIGGPA
jgi:hypothetical protein